MRPLEIFSHFVRTGATFFNRWSRFGIFRRSPQLQKQLVLIVSKTQKLQAPPWWLFIAFRKSRRNSLGTDPLRPVIKNFHGYISWKFKLSSDEKVSLLCTVAVEKAFESFQYLHFQMGQEWRWRDGPVAPDDRSDLTRLPFGWSRPTRHRHSFLLPLTADRVLLVRSRHRHRWHLWWSSLLRHSHPSWSHRCSRDRLWARLRQKQHPSSPASFHRGRLFHEVIFGVCARWHGWWHGNQSRCCGASHIWNIDWFLPIAEGLIDNKCKHSASLQSNLFNGICLSLIQTMHAFRLSWVAKSIKKNAKIQLHCSLTYLPTFFYLW